MGAVGLIDWTRRGIENSIDLPGGGALHASAFQRRFWREISKVDWFSASAPTSAGKSFIITQWLVEQLAASDRVIVYIAPTRALIQQVERDLREVLREHGLGRVAIVTIPFNERVLAKEGAKVLVFTQERLHYFLRNHGSTIPIHAIVVDEAPSASRLDYRIVNAVATIMHGARSLPTKRQIREAENVERLKRQLSGAGALVAFGPHAMTAILDACEQPTFCSGHPGMQGVNQLPVEMVGTGLENTRQRLDLFASQLLGSRM